MSSSRIGFPARRTRENPWSHTHDPIALVALVAPVARVALVAHVIRVAQTP